MLSERDWILRSAMVFMALIFFFPSPVDFGHWAVQLSKGKPKIIVSWG